MPHAIDQDGTRPPLPLFMDFWFQELRQGKLVYDDGSGSYLDPGMESQIQIEVSQEVMDQLQMDADYPRFHFQ